MLFLQDVVGLDGDSEIVVLLAFEGAIEFAVLAVVGADHVASATGRTHGVEYHAIAGCEQGEPVVTVFSALTCIEQLLLNRRASGIFPFGLSG